MTKQELIENLKKLNDEGIKKAKIEQDLEMPSNCLSRFMSKEDGSLMADKWVEPLVGYVRQHSNPSYETQVSEDEPLEPTKTRLVIEKEGLKERPTETTSAKLQAVMDKINKDFGENTIMRLGDRPIRPIETISTGSIGLDKALGIGGLPRGRIVEIYGPESGGKTTIALHVIAEAQKIGLKCLLIDAEYAFDPEYAAALGVDVNSLRTCQPDYGEQGLEAADRSIVSGEFGVVVIDSVAALIPKGELEGEHGESKMGLHARLMSQACRKMTGSIGKTNTLCIFINQIRNKIGVVYGNPEVTTGGMALQFYASVRLDVRVTAKIKDGEDLIGNRIKVKITKNKCSPPYKIAEFDIMYGEGINRRGEVLDIAVEKGIIKKAGSWYAYGEEKLGQGREYVIQLFKDNPTFFKEIEDAIK